MDGLLSTLSEEGIVGAIAAAAIGYSVWATRRIFSMYEKQAEIDRETLRQQYEFIGLMKSIRDQMMRGPGA